MDHYTEEEYEIGIAIFTKLIEQDRSINLPISYRNRGKIYFTRGKMFFDEGDLTNALKDYYKAIDLNPNYDTAYNDRGEIYLFIGKYELAYSDFAQALKINPNYKKALENLKITKKRLSE